LKPPLLILLKDWVNMKVSVSKSQVHGILDAPPSKSYTIRALICAALSPGQSYIRRPLSSDDTLAACDVLQKVGAEVRHSAYGWRVNGGPLSTPNSELFCHDSAATFRFMIALSALVPGTVRLVPGPGLAKRPVIPLLDAMGQLGVKCRLDGTVAVIEGGSFTGGSVKLAGDISSQFISALLLAAPLTRQGIHIKLTTALSSSPYIDMTIDCLKKFGIRVSASPDMSDFKVTRQDYRAAEYTIEGDWSQASYLLALGALSGDLVVTNLNAESLQGDRVALNLLQKMGVRLTVRRSSVGVQKSYIHGISADLTDCIDLLPTLTVLAAAAEGESQFSGIKSARLKESNRVETLKQELQKMGIRVREEENTLTIVGGRPRGATIDSHGDHRLAMAFGVLGTALGDTTILGAESVEKTYPEFWKALETLGVGVKSDVKQSG
jgi:3-phosphoshikimate 1-carboxyvinyltransferase